jgi:hypothetical protein
MKQFLKGLLALLIVAGVVAVVLLVSKTLGWLVAILYMGMALFGRNGR